MARVCAWPVLAVLAIPLALPYTLSPDPGRVGGHTVLCLREDQQESHWPDVLSTRAMMILIP